MAIRTSIRAAALAALVIVTGLAPSAPVLAADARAPVLKVAASEGTSRFIPLGIGKSVAIDLPADIKDVLVADPKIANAVIRSSRRVYMIGVTVGQTNIFFFDADGKQIAGFDIAVTRDLNGVRAALKQTMPDADIRIEGVGDGIMLSGSAASPVEAQKAFDLAARLVGDKEKEKVINSIVVNGRDQVMLKVTVAEVERTVIKQLGINITGSAGVGSAVVNFNTTNLFPINGPPTSNVQAALTGTGIFKSVTANLRAMEQAGVVHILAEPTLTAISGEPASFLVGGEFSIPPAATVGSTTTSDKPQFKPYGVSLSFTPVVMSEGRISLNVKTEVSEIDPANTIQGVPGIKLRRANTTVEIPSGGSLAMAGMIKEQTKQAITGFPGLMQLPILGTLFKSRDYLNNQSELMILVTPYIVHAVAQKQLSRPDDGFADPADQSSVLLGRLNRIYGAAGKTEPPPSEYHGKYGFILD